MFYFKYKDTLVYNTDNKHCLLRNLFLVHQIYLDHQTDHQLGVENLFLLAYQVDISSQIDLARSVLVVFEILSGKTMGLHPPSLLVFCIFEID